MSCETPVSLKKKAIQSKKKFKCLIHYDCVSNSDDLKEFTEKQWANVQNAKRIRSESNEPKFQCLEICESIPEHSSQEHRFHQKCLKRFTMITSLKVEKAQKRKNECDEEDVCLNKKKRTSVSELNGTIWPTKCIFCNNYQLRKTKGGVDSREGLVNCVTEDAKSSIKEAAHRKSDSRVISLVDNFCLISKEAKYHETCRKLYIRLNQTSNTKCLPENKTKQRENAHNQSFNHMCDYIKKSVLNDLNIEYPCSKKNTLNT